MPTTLKYLLFCEQEIPGVTKRARKIKEGTSPANTTPDEKAKRLEEEECYQLKDMTLRCLTTSGGSSRRTDSG